MTEKVIKNFLKLRFPGPYLLAHRLWHAPRRWAFERRLMRTHDRLVSVIGGRVAGGPFEGMAYLDTASSSALLPKLVGSYEAELHEAIERMVERGYATIVDIGAAEGYYAVGLALRLPGARIFAFDSDASARTLCGEMAKLNGVADQVTILGRCDPESLAGVMTNDALVVCDCEGYEYELLDPMKIPALRDADLIVEVHDFMDARITPALLERFRDSHRIDRHAPVGRDLENYPALRSLPAAARRLAVEERRTAHAGFLVLTRVPARVR